MQIWKFNDKYGFIWKQYPENVAFIIPIILQLFKHEDCIFLKK